MSEYECSQLSIARGYQQRPSSDTGLAALLSLARQKSTSRQKLVVMNAAFTPGLRGLAEKDADQSLRCLHFAVTSLVPEFEELELPPGDVSIAYLCLLLTLVTEDEEGENPVSRITAATQQALENRSLFSHSPTGLTPSSEAGNAWKST